MALSKTTRILLAIGSLALGITFFVPLWQILLWAPQYPEGLTMKIWHNTISGEIDIINGLNHYIGMKHISVEMFPEFNYIGILIGFLMLVGLAAAISGRSIVLFAFTLLSYLYGIVALWDFWHWGYEYGHNLDPKAAIIVPDMTYQPPLIGYKNLLNFTSFSGPDLGAWVIIVVCLMATALWWWTFFKNRKKAPNHNGLNGKKLRIVGLLLLAFYSCSTGPEAIRFGQDSCTNCKMTLSDKRFGAEIVTKKGKVFKFDDLNCLVAYLKKSGINEQDIAQILTVDFKKTALLIDIQKAYFLQNEGLKSPMRGDVASFSSQSDLDGVKTTIGGGKEMTWPEVKAGF